MYFKPEEHHSHLASSCFHTESPARAVTRNKESFRSRNADTLDTVIVVDGLPRVIQTEEHIEYTPYGETWLNTRRGNDDDHDDDEWDWDDDEGSPIRWRFTGKEIDPETGLQYFGARYQDPRTSRWISSDPAGPELMVPMDDEGRLRSGYSVVEALNWYSYTSNNPVKYRDPTGMMGQKDGARSEAAKIVIAGLPTMLIDSAGSAGIAGTMLSLVMEAETIMAGVVGVNARNMRVEAHIQKIGAGDFLDKPEGKWNDALADFHMALSEYLIDIAGSLTGDDAFNGLSSSGKYLDVKKEELAQFLYDSQENPFYEEGKTYTTNDLEYKSLPDE